MGRYFSDGILIVFIFCFLLFLEITQPCSCENLTAGCIEQERQALIKFRSSLQQNYTLSYYFASWEGGDCCKWKGIKCDDVTGHVVRVDLAIKCDMGGRNYSCMQLAQVVSPSLLELKYLNHLDLTAINFQGSPIPIFFGSMKQLRYLNLSNCLFSGRVPHQLGNLTNLKILDLNTVEPLLYVDDISWASQLSSLQYIDLSGVLIKKTDNFMQVIYKLPFLLLVHFMYCSIDSLKFSHGFVNSTFATKIQVLNLRGNALSGPIPSSLRSMSSIRVLDLSQNNLDSVPLWFGEFKNLVHLNLAQNRLSGLIPSAFQNMSSVRFLNLSCNSLTSSVPQWVTKNYLQALDLSHNEFSGHMASIGELKNLVYLSLASNAFSGPFPSSFRKMANLRELILKDNQLNGTIPTFLGKLLTLRVLDLSGNHLNGIIPDTLGKLLNLHILDLSSNSLEGTLHETHLANLTYLHDLRVGLNKLTAKLTPDWLPPFQLTTLHMQSCKIETQFPLWLQTQKKLISLDLSDSGISGTIPIWFQQVDLSELYLSSNKITGPLPENLNDMMPKLGDLFLGNNLINGSIPNSLCKLQGLSSLDLSKNKLSSKIPDCLGQNFLLEILDLSSNQLLGSIPKSLCSFESGYLLQSLNLSNNSLHEELPLELVNCMSLAILDLGGNKLSGVIPSWIGEAFPSLQILRLRQNMFSGRIPLSLCQLPKMQSLDLAYNNLIGPIPHCFGSLIGMKLDHSSYKETETMAPAIAVDFPGPAPAVSVLAPEFNQWDKEDVKQVFQGREIDYTKNLRFVVSMDLSNNRLIGFIPEVLTSLSGLVSLNLSHNHFSGTIPSKIGRMKSLESLDFCCNQLSGSIPDSMPSLTSLSHLNLSYNNFSGPIPEANQFLTLNEPSIYAGNPYLCGVPVLNKCYDNDTHQTPTSIRREDDQGSSRDEEEKILFYFVVALGFMTGFWGVIGFLMFKRNWRHAYFRYVEKVADKMYVAIAIRVARLKKRNGERTSQ